jgi:hypothetical protein
MKFVDLHGEHWTISTGKGNDANQDDDASLLRQSRAYCSDAMHFLFFFTSIKNVVSSTRETVERRYMPL